MNKAVKGYLSGALAAASYGTNPLFALPLLNKGIDAYSVLFLRYVFAIPMLAAMMLARGRGFGLRRNQIVPLMVLGVLMAMSSLTLFISYSYIGAAIASTLLFVYPILVTIIMSLFFREKASFTTVFCILLATCGIGMLYRGDNGATLNTTGLVFIFLSALSYAIYLVAVNGKKLKDVPTLKLTLYVILSGTVIYGAKFNVHCIDILSADPWLWSSAFCLALFPTAISLLSTSAAIHEIGSTPVAILGALEPVTAVAIAVTVFNERLTWQLVTGILFVIVAVTLLIAGGKLNPYLLRVRKMFPRIRRGKE